MLSHCAAISCERSVHPGGPLRCSGEQQRLDQLGVGERDPPDVEPGEERGRVEVARRLVPDDSNGLEEVAVELVGDVLPAVLLRFEPLVDALVGLEDVEEVDVLLASRLVGALAGRPAARPGLVLEGVGRPSARQSLGRACTGGSGRASSGAAGRRRAPTRRRALASRRPAAGSTARPCSPDVVEEAADLVAPQR